MTTHNNSRRGLNFVKRVYPARALGLGLGALAVGAALQQQPSSWLLWVLWAFNGFVWPHLAYHIAIRSRTPYQAERRHLLLDSLIGGFSVASIGFNPLASSVIVMMVWMNNTAAGGSGLFARGVASSLLGLVAGLAILGWHWNIVTTDWIVYASLPMLVVYPVAIGSITHRLAMQLHRQKELLQRLSRTDGLTGLYNRHYWESRVEDLIAQVRRHPQPLSLILLDVDHFKTINDTYGHSMGDQVLLQIAQQLRSNLRESELLGRYGGEEFALVLPNTTAEAAQATAERLRRIVAQSEFGGERQQGHKRLHCTISLGVAAWHTDFTNYAGWFHAADVALYQAKHRGRNTTVVHTPARAIETTSLGEVC